MVQVLVTVGANRFIVRKERTGRQQCYAVNAEGGEDLLEDLEVVAQVIEEILRDEKLAGALGL